jgi:hypothetical protein
MTPIDSAAISIAVAGLLIAPLIAVGVFAIVQSRWTSAGRRAMFVCILTIVFVAAAATAGLSFKKVLVNVALFGVAYGAYCFLVVCCWRVRLLPLRILVLLCGLIPVGLGYVTSTIGLLGLMFIVGDYSRAPTRSTKSRRDSSVASPCGAWQPARRAIPSIFTGRGTGFPS